MNTKKTIVSTATNPNFWDCECEENYIHPATHGARTKCKKCGALEKDMPDSRVDEVKFLYNQI